MRSYRTFIIIFSLLLLLYVLAEVNKPKPLDWTVTLSKEDKNPYGAFILFDRLKDLFPSSTINVLREPAYNVLHDNEMQNAAYIIVAPVFGAAETDTKELLRFAERGNYVFLSVEQTSKLLRDTLGLTNMDFDGVFGNDSTSLNFVNPSLKSNTNYKFRKYTVDDCFGNLNKKDSTTILGITNASKPDFVKVKIGEGAFFIHAAPLCFSNYFMLFNNNHEYVSKAMSYIPANVKTIYWDEYYKLGRTGATTPLRFFINNEWLRWALRLTIFGFIIYVLIEMKRRQRIIPVIEPLRNTTLDFVKTVAGVYLGQKDNKSIANSKFQYWLHYIRNKYHLQTNELNEDFVKSLSRKTGYDTTSIQKIIDTISAIQQSRQVPDSGLLDLNSQIEKFYTYTK